MKHVKNCEVCFQPILRCSCPKKVRSAKVARVSFNQVVRVLDQINDQLVGMNTSVNNNVNNLSTVLSNNNSNINHNISSSIASLSSSVANTLRTSTNTVISNMNTVQTMVCTVQTTTLWSDFAVPCGSSRIFFENFSAPTTEKVIVRAGSFQPLEAPCRAVLIITQQNGNVIERLLPWNGSETKIQIDNYSNIAIRCDFGDWPPPPEYSDCKGFIEVKEFFCVCCQPA